MNKLIAALIVTFLSTGLASAVTIETVPVGNPGNAADTRYIDSNHPTGVGSVAYPFRIGKTEVTNAHYVEFLNAVADADPYGLYSTFMESEPQGGIVQTGASGTYFYAVKPAALSGTYIYDEKPVVFVSSGDAMRFANWLHNGQPSAAQDPSTTEDGAYTLNGATTNDALAAVTRNPGARWWLPTEDEWYKAAYFDPSGLYYDYPTTNNSVPSNNLPSADTGNSANFSGGGYTTGNSDYPMTDAGAYVLSESSYSTLDQGGNVFEWNETLFFGDLPGAVFRGLRGGSWNGDAGHLHASIWANDSPSFQSYYYGFRVASIPEPSTLLLVAMAGFGLLFPRPTRNY